MFTVDFLIAAAAVQRTFLPFFLEENAFESVFKFGFQTLESDLKKRVFFRQVYLTSFFQSIYTFQISTIVQIQCVEDIINTPAIIMIRPH